MKNDRRHSTSAHHEVAFVFFTPSKWRYCKQLYTVPIKIYRRHGWQREIKNLHRAFWNSVQKELLVDMGANKWNKLPKICWGKLGWRDFQAQQYVGHMFFIPQFLCTTCRRTSKRPALKKNPSSTVPFTAIDAWCRHPKTWSEDDYDAYCKYPDSSARSAYREIVDHQISRKITCSTLPRGTQWVMAEIWTMWRTCFSSPAQCTMLRCGWRGQATKQDSKNE